MWWKSEEQRVPFDGTRNVFPQVLIQLINNILFSPSLAVLLAVLLHPSPPSLPPKYQHVQEALPNSKVP